MTEFCVPVSVVIPCFVCRDTIERAVLSVLRQTMLPREILLIDDASPDDGATARELNRLAHEYGDQVPIRVVLQRENRGPGSARNRGWELAKEPYIAFLDADDAWLHQKLQYQYTWMRDHPEYSLTCHEQLLLNEELKDIDDQNLCTSVISSQEISKFNLLYFNSVATRTVMLKRELPYRFTEGKRYSEDYLLWLLLVHSGFRASKINLTLAATFKPDFGASGLSSRLIRMELGELDCYLRLYRSNFIGTTRLLKSTGFSLLKFVRRIFLTIIRRHGF